MTFSRHKAGVAGLILLGCTALVQPVQAFELFGIHLWGEKKQDDADEVIAEPQRYDVEVVANEQNGSESIVDNSSLLVADKSEPASGAAGLIAKARGDYKRILGAMYADGRYGGTISITIDGKEASNLLPDVKLQERAKVTITVDAGPQYLFANAGITNRAPEPVDPKDRIEQPEKQGYERGKVARSTAVIRAERLAVDAWRHQGHPKARITDRSVTADHAGRGVNATIVVDPDRRAVFAPVQVKGTSRMDPEFVAYMTGLKPGQEYDPKALDKAQKRLSRLEVFRSARFEEGETISREGVLPISLAVQEQPLRRIGAGASYSTLDGAGVETYWLHRNLFGKAEKLRFDARVAGIGGQSYDPRDYTYTLGASFMKPGIFTPDTDFIASITGQREVLEAYTRTSLAGQAGFTHIFSDKLSGKLTADAARSRFDDDVFGTRDFLTAGLNGSLLYDSRNNKPNPTRGFYLEGTLSPFYEFEYGNIAGKFTAEGRTYFGFGENDRVVLAARLKLGAITGAPISELPSDQLFFAGGGGSVRGYAYRNIGVDVANGGTVDVIGGRSLIEGSVEARIQVTKNIGVVGFADAGNVGEKAFPDFSEDLRIGVGAGIRYNTGLGPIRLDVAVPLDPRKNDPDFAVYIGIGQAF